MMRWTMMVFTVAAALAARGGYAGERQPHGKAPHAAHGVAMCPVMKTAIKDKSKVPKMLVNNSPVYFCCAGCDDKLKAEPAKYLKSPVADPVTGKPFNVTAKTPKMAHGSDRLLFSSHSTHEKFQADPHKYTKHGAHGAGHKDHKNSAHGKGNKDHKAPH